jgi:hypothetical protein
MAGTASRAGRFLDFPVGKAKNETMARGPRPVLAALSIGAALAFPGAIGTGWGATSTTVDKLYWCPGMTGKEIQLTSQPGCSLLVVDDKVKPKKDQKGVPRKPKERPPIKTDDLETAVGTFLQDYNQFLSCCAEDNSDSALEDIEDLLERSSHVLRQVLGKMQPSSLLLARNQSLIVSLVRARDRLHALESRIEQLDASYNKLDTLDYEAAGRARRDIREAEEAKKKDFQPVREPSRAPTGPDIGKSAPTGSAIGSGAPTGVDIGKPAPPGPEFGSTPPTMTEILDMPPGERPGGSLDTTTPLSTGKVGPAIGTTPATGPEIGSPGSNK